jgi:hypothetical protein
MPKEWVFVGRDIHGDKMFKLRNVRPRTDPQVPSMDDVLPAGVEGPLLKEPPEVKPVEPVKPEGGSKGERWFPTFIEMSQPPGLKKDE